MTAARELVAKLAIAERVQFPGYLSHARLEPLIRGSLCLVFTSLVEGFGNPPLEAMVRGCPAVASDSTAIPEVVGDAGLLVQPGNPSAFADAVLRIANEPGLREVLVRRGLERAKRFSWNASAAALATLIRSVAPSGQSQSSRRQSA
jgi:glycosyltransferase involved in cell wall biosynthesis